MTRHTYIFMLFVFILSCSDQKTNGNRNTSDLFEQAKTAFREGNNSAKNRDNFEAIKNYNKSILLFDSIDDPENNQYIYLALRQRALALNRLNSYHLAANSMKNALYYLSISKDLRYDRHMEEVSSKRFLATYLRNNFDFDESNEIMFGYLEDESLDPNIRGQFRNMAGLNYLDLRQYKDAFYQFDLALKNDTEIDIRLKANYLQNRAMARYHIGEVQEAFQDMREAVGLNEGIGDEVIFNAFDSRLELGELYLLEDNYEQAFENFELALMKDINIQDDPKLFRIHNLRYAAAIGLNDKNKNLYKDEFDRLEARYKAMKEQLNDDFESANLGYGLDKVDYAIQAKRDQRNMFLYVILPYLLPALLMIGVLLVFVKRYALKGKKLLDLAEA